MENKHIVKIEKITREQALCALFNRAKPQGLGKLHYRPEHRLDEVNAGLILCAGDYVDYLEGRVIKTEFKLGKNEIDCTLYDRDNGDGAGERAIDEYLQKVEGRCPNTFVPKRFMGEDRIETDVRGVPGFRFDILGGQLYVYEMPDRIFSSCLTQQYFSFTMFVPHSNQEIHAYNVYDGRPINEEMFRHFALRAIQAVINKLAEV